MISPGGRMWKQYAQFWPGRGGFSQPDLHRLLSGMYNDHKRLPSRFWRMITQTPSQIFRLRPQTASCANGRRWASRTADLTPRPSWPGENMGTTLPSCPFWWPRLGVDDAVGFCGDVDYDRLFQGLFSYRFSNCCFQIFCIRQRKNCRAVHQVRHPAKKYFRRRGEHFNLIVAIVIHSKNLFSSDTF